LGSGRGDTGFARIGATAGSLHRRLAALVGAKRSARDAAFATTGPGPRTELSQTLQGSDPN